MRNDLRFADRIRGCLGIIRPVNVLIVGISVAIGSYLSGTLLALKVLLACVSAGMILGAGNAINDVSDSETDSINNPKRPIPSGLLTRRAASIIGVLLFSLGILLSWLISFSALLMAISCCALLVAYAVWLKRQGLWGNLLVSMLTALAFIYGGVAVRNPVGALFPAAFAFLFHLGREIVKDVADVKGDRSVQARTFPVLFGERAGVLFSAAVFALLILVTPLPFVFGLYGVLYLIFVLVGVDLVLAVIVASLIAHRSWMNTSRASTLLKMDMVAGLVALVVGRI